MRISLPLAALLAVVITWGSQARVPLSGVQTPISLPHQASQLIVRYETGADTAAIIEALANLGGVQLLMVEAVDLMLVGIDEDAELPVAMALLQAQSGVIYAELNYVQALDVRPNDIDFSLQWSKENRGINAPNGQGNIDADLNLVDAWDGRSKAPDVIVGIIDDSVETMHIDLLGNVLSSGKCYSSPQSSRPCINGEDDPNPGDTNDFHGTLVAGTAGARGNNSLGIAGAAWEVSLLPLKVDLTTFAIAQAIDEAIRQNADIVNMSFGGPVQSRTIDDAVARAEGAGILVVASAGNADSNNSLSSHYPSDSSQNNVLSVAATNANDAISGFSQWGSDSVHLAAPGELVRTTAVNNQYAVVSGTSFASPHVAGVAALVKAHTGAPDYRQIKASLLHGVSNGRSTIGSVTPGQNKNEIPGRVATGRLDAAKALQIPNQGVVVIKEIVVDDAPLGNGNGELDPGESAQLVITLYNAWSDETAVSGVLSITGDTDLTVDELSPVVFGDIPQEGTQSARFNVSLSPGSVGNRNFFMQLDLSSSGTLNLAQRYFYLETGTLQNGVPVSQQIQRWNWDEFHAFHIDVPLGRTNLSVETSGSGDIDLLLLYERAPEYLITLDAQRRGINGFYYVEPNTQVSGTDGAEEAISLSNPAPGTYHIVVVNYDQAAKNYTLTATHSGPDTDTIAFSNANYTVSESQPSVQITVSRSGTIGEASARYSTSQGSATPGLDYTETSGTLTWGSGETGDKVFTIPVLDDTDNEPSETVVLTLSDVTGASIGQPDSATLTLQDDDTDNSVLAFGQQMYTVQEAAGQIVVVVSRTGNTDLQASVTVGTTSQSAVAGEDFQQTSNTLSWSAGDSEPKTITIPIIDDSIDESIESFLVVLTAPQGATVATQSTTTVNIEDDDVPPNTGPVVSGSGGGGRLGWFELCLAFFLLALRQRQPSLIKAG